MRSGLPIFECPFTNEQIHDPATTPCGHTFELEKINAWITQKKNEKQPCLCPSCRAVIKVKSLKTNVALKAILEEKATAAQENLQLKAEILQLKQQLKAKNQQVQQLCYEEKKADSMVQGRIPIQQEIAFAQNRKNAQHLANGVKQQAGLFIYRYFLGNMIRKLDSSSYKIYQEYKETKKEIIANHTARQESLITALQQNTQKLNTHNILNADQILTEVQRLKYSISRDVATMQTELEALRSIYQDTVIFPRDRLSRYLQCFLSLSQKIKESSEHLKDLREIEKLSKTEALTYSEETTEKTLTLFGGNRLKSASATQNAELLAAVKRKDFNKVKNLLVSCHFNLEMRDENGHTLLYISILNLDYKMMDLLIAKRADINALINWRDVQVPLLSMVILSDDFEDEEKCEILRKLLSAGANVNALTSAHQDTPLHWAANISSEEIIKLLLEFNANPLLVNTGGHTALSVASDKVNKDDDSIALLQDAKDKAEGVSRKKPSRIFCF